MDPKTWIVLEPKERSHLPIKFMATSREEAITHARWMFVRVSPQYAVYIMEEVN